MVSISRPRPLPENPLPLAHLLLRPQDFTVPHPHRCRLPTPRPEHHPIPSIALPRAPANPTLQIDSARFSGISQKGFASLGAETRSLVAEPSLLLLDASQTSP